MKLLLRLSPLFPIRDAADDVQLEEMESVPRSERFPAHPPHDEFHEEVDHLIDRDRERMFRYTLYL